MYDYTPMINCSVRKVTLRAVHFWVPCLAGVPPHDTNEYHFYTMTNVRLYCRNINFKKSDFAGRTLLCPVFIKG